MPEDNEKCSAQGAAFKLLVLSNQHRYWMYNDVQQGRATISQIWEAWTSKCFCLMNDSKEKFNILGSTLIYPLAKS